MSAPEFDPRGWFVYQLYEDDADAPFYVGMSANIFGRLGSHSLTYRGRIARVRLIRCETREDMQITERHLIQKYQPAENIMGVRMRASALDG